MRYSERDPLSTGPDVMARLRANEPLLSLGIRASRTGDVARMASAAGYAVVWIDLEHSSMSSDCAANMAAVAHDLGLAAWVRIPERDYGAIGPLLDCGATGIISPKVETAQEARLAAAACRFPPNGQRSMIALLPQFGFSRLPVTEMVRRADAAVVLQILIESAKGVENVDAIAAVEGVDIIGVGTNDLCADLGCPGDARDPRVVESCRAIAAAAARHGKIAVIGGIGNGDEFVEALAMGFAPLIFAGIDTDIIANGIAQRGADWRSRLAAAGRATS